MPPETDFVKVTHQGALLIEHDASQGFAFSMAMAPHRVKRSSPSPALPTS